MEWWGSQLERFLLSLLASLIAAALAALVTVLWRIWPGKLRGVLTRATVATNLFTIGQFFNRLDKWRALDAAYKSATIVLAIGIVVSGGVALAFPHRDSNDSPGTPTPTTTIPVPTATPGTAETPTPEPIPSPQPTPSTVAGTPMPSVMIETINDGAPVEGVAPVNGTSIGLAGATLFVLVYDLNDGRTWPYTRFVVDEDGTINTEVRVCSSDARYRLVIARGRTREDDLALEDWLLNDSITPRDGTTLGGIQVQRWTRDFESGRNADLSPRCRDGNHPF
jgi:hypothetical protein